ncbi:MAG: hypothetical protein U1E28_18545 [Beijerinckiaceae bacterium]
MSAGLWVFDLAGADDPASDRIERMLDAYSGLAHSVERVARS